jgi:hypothetical protein
MKHYQEELPLYVAGLLSPAEVSELEKHLEGCPACQAEQEFWRVISVNILEANTSVVPPGDLVERALSRIHVENRSPKQFIAFRQMNTAFQRTFSLLRAQSYLVQQEIWPTSAGVMALGVIVALLSNHVEAITFIIPLVAAACLAMLHNPEQDPAYELVLAAPTSYWKILLARLSIVSTYNLLLALLASLALLVIVPPDLLGRFILGWLAPMAFLSTLALLLSLFIGTNNAIAVSYGLWIIQYLEISKILNYWGYSNSLDRFWEVYRGFWQSPGLLFALSLVLLGVALLSTRRAAGDIKRIPA